MRTIAMVVGALAAFAIPVVAAEDPIAVRQALMQSNAASAGPSAAMMKGELEYNPAVAKAAIMAFNATGHAVGDFFPEGTSADDNENTTASPKIWEDMAGFQAKLGEFQTAVAAAVEAAGKDGPADAAAFTAAIQPVLGTCQGCHETYRIQRQ